MPFSMTQIAFLAGALTLASLATPAVGQTSSADATAVVRGYVQAVVDGDWDAAVAHFAADAVRLPMNAPAVRGHAAIRQSLGAVDSVPDWTIRSIEVETGPVLAYARFQFTMTIFLRGSPQPFTYAGKQLSVLKRQPDGRWLILTDMWNTDSFGP
ncbi:MAG: nuclear transport factor 2 family protein [Gemmatimonadota bacterium]|nr:nuclear transport factor 2 family protein [Gemmatimonadota bacterium]